jgi:hypothetical protein
MTIKIRSTVVALSLSMLLLAVPAQSGPAGAQAGRVPAMQNAALALAVLPACSALPRLVNFLAYLRSLPKQGPIVQFLERVTQDAIDHLLSQGCTL